MAEVATQKCSTVSKKCDALAMSNSLVEFLNESWTPFHAVEEASKLLVAAGFQKLSERATWDVKPGGKYFFTRNMSALVAFAVGEKYQPGNGFYMIGAHTDSPCFKLKPVSKGTKSGFLMVNVEPYGGGLWHTWFDRDLSVAGRVLVREGAVMKHKLVKVTKPILRIPMLAIHLYKDLSDGFKPNKQTHCTPLLTSALQTAVGNGVGNGVAANGKGDSGGVNGAAAERHHPLLLDFLAKDLGCSPADIVDFELNVCDTQPGVVGGPQDEFVLCGRLDNLVSSYVALKALIQSVAEPGALGEEEGVRAIALFDHEEVGSNSAQGAGSPLMLHAIQRVTKALSPPGTEGAVERAIQSSFLVSADMAHGLHPNYSDKHDADHQPRFGNGLVLKHNSNQRYATNSVSAALFREVGARRGIPVQEYCVRSDMACGSTIGPILAASLGCRTLDVGAPQLSMHSIREMCGTQDVGHAYDHFLAFFETFNEVNKMVCVDDLPPPDIRGEILDTPCPNCG